MMLLPKPPTSACLRTFWLLVSLNVGLLVGAALAWNGGAVPAWVGGGLVAAAMSAPGLVRPYAVALPYRVWNVLAARVAGLLSRYVTAIGLLVVALAGRSSAASRFVASSPGSSMWVERRSQPAAAYHSQYHDDRVGVEQDGWARSVRDWADRSGNRWAWSLVPLLRVLQLLDAAPEKGRPAAAPDIYTLY